MCNQVQSNTIRYNQVQSGTIRYNRVQSGTIRYNQVQSGTIKYNQVQLGTIRYYQVPSGTIRYQWVPVDTSVPVYQVYQEDQEQISGDTYISNVVFRFVIHQCTSIQYILHSSQVMLWGRNQAERLPCFYAEQFGSSCLFML